MDFYIKGTVTNQLGQPVSNLIVALFLAGKAIGKASRTGKSGGYELDVTLPEMEGEPDGKDNHLELRVFSAEKKLLGKHKLSMAESPKQRLDLMVALEKEQVPFRVTGKVTAASKPVPGLKVFIAARTLRSSFPITTGTTTRSGRYDISFNLDASLAKDLAIEIEVRNQDKKSLFKSGAIHDIGRVLRYDITLRDAHPDLSQWEARVQTVRQALGGDLDLTDLKQDDTHDDIAFLSSGTGLPKDDLEKMALAHNLAATSRIDPEFWGVMLETPFYPHHEGQSLEDQLNLAKQGTRLLDVTTAEKKIRGAMAQGRIPKRSDKDIQAWLSQLERFAAEQSLEVRFDGRPNFTRHSLESAGIQDKEKQVRFAILFKKHRRFSQALLEDLGQDERFSKNDIERLHATHQLGELMGQDVRVVEAIRTEFKVRTPADVAKLARNGRKDWIQFAKSRLPEGPVPERDVIPGLKNQDALNSETFGAYLEKQFKQAFPTSSFRGGLDRALESGQSLSLKEASKLGKLLDRNPELELHQTPVDRFIEAAPELGRDEQFSLEFKATQRLFKLNQDFDAVNTLLADNVHSAHQVYRMGKTTFVEQYKTRPGFDETGAARTWTRAAETHAATMTLVAELQNISMAGEFAGLAAGTGAVSAFPNYQNLFQTGDLCACEHCRSVYSPAAYFADLLLFLKDRKAINPAITLKQLLFERRPDLGYLELNCDNAHVTLPYIDVVNEVLEDVVADGANDLELVGLPTISADPVTAKSDVLAAFSAHGIELDPDLHLSRIEGTTDWVVHTAQVTYLLTHKISPSYFAVMLRNTKAKADELRAAPQYVNQAAYRVLKSETFPQALPFDLFGEEARLALEKSKLHRWDMMTVFRGPAAPNNPTPGQVAAEFFGIASDPSLPLDEMRIILEAETITQHQFWGQADAAAMIAHLTGVKRFLVATGLVYQDLLQMLDLAFLNPAGQLRIDHLDATCNLDQKEILNLTVSHIDRIHRFLRLWRKTSLAMWELDLLVRHPAIGNGSLNEAFLVRLKDFLTLKKSLGRKAGTEEVASLFGPLNTTTRFTELHEPREDALYQQLFLNKKYVQPLDDAFAVGAVDVANSVETISGHASVVLTGLRIRQDDLDTLLALDKASDGTPYIADELTLANLSFLFRHAWLAKTLKLKMEDWAALLKVLNQDLPQFADPRAALDFLTAVQHLQATDLDFDTLHYILSAETTAEAAVEEAQAAKFLQTLRQALQAIEAKFDGAQYDFLQAAPPVDSGSLGGLLEQLLQQLARDENTLPTMQAIFLGTVANEVEVTGLPPAFTFPAAIADLIAIGYNETTGLMRFTGTMTDAERTMLLTDPSLAAVTGILDYQDAIDALYWQPRLIIKFFQPSFEARLPALQEAIDLATQLEEELATKVAYNPETSRLRFAGLMTKAERETLKKLTTDADFLAAVDELYDQPRTGSAPAGQIWLTDADLVLPMNEANLAQNLANACNGALAYLRTTQSRSETVTQLSGALGLSAATIEYILDEVQLHPPETIFEHLNQTFAATDSPLTYAAYKDTFDTYAWLSRLATLISAWRLDLADIQWLIARQAGTQTLDFRSLPVDDNQPIASAEHLIRTQRLLALRHRIKEEGITLFELLGNTLDGTYANAAAFADDVEAMTDGAWSAQDVEAFVNTVDLNFPGDFGLAENLERLERALYFANKLNTSVAKLLALAAAAVDDSAAAELRQILRDNYGADTWLTLSTEIQDAMRERKRDSLLAWHLAQPQPANAPSGKWENANDVYAYYLLDIEMSACMLTSRLVQGAGSIQLFVMRCFMGLEPEVTVNVDGDNGDSAWEWWNWMRKYRVWEANRKVFLYPENWIEPELRLDKSPFFTDLENELLQNELNATTIEDAFIHYFEKLNAVAQLEIAGFFHEDNGDEAILHVFGRSGEGEPRTYYYRQFDYRRWTPWKKVEADITGDHLVPAVINHRVFLFWPIFTEIPDEAKNSSLTTPSADEETTLEPVYKRLRMQLASIEYRNGQWTPKKTSTDFIESNYYTGEITAYNIEMYVIDQSQIEGDFGIAVGGNATTSTNYAAHLYGDFTLFGCKGVPEGGHISGYYTQVASPDEAEMRNLRHYELTVRSDAPQNDFALVNANGIPFFLDLGEFQLPILLKTPKIFKTNMSWAMSYLDRLLQDFSVHYGGDENTIPVGTWLPYFYADKTRTFFVLPVVDFQPGRNSPRLYYPQIKGAFKELHEMLEGLVHTMMAGFDPTLLSQQERMALTAWLENTFNLEGPFTDERIVELLIRFVMMFFDFFLGAIAVYTSSFRRHHFKNFYHPFVCAFSKQVYNPTQGIAGLMRRDTQLQEGDLHFFYEYMPTPLVLDYPFAGEYPREDVDFAPDGAYASYNWELFYHAPLLIANRLSQDQQFEEAMQWYHYIFNPLGVEGILPDGTQASAPQKYWITKPFFLTTSETYYQQRIDSIMRIIAGDATVDGFTAGLKSELEAQVLDWRNHPFEPHKIAQYRTVAYQKAVFMKYLDNLIAWGDYLFRQDSMESINEATQLYVIAAELLGPRPQKVPPAARVPMETFNELESEFDAFSNALVQVENFVPAMPGNGSAADSAPIPMLYFCIPQNEKLSAYYDTVADRLYKIRHCMNIDGVVRSLSLFEPPIDPAALVKAVAGGMSIGAALADLNAPLPCYRFNTLIMRAKELVSDVQALGTALLSALEKKDAEDLSLLRQSQEIKVAEAVQTVRELQIAELEESLEALKKSKETVEVKRDFYRQIDYLNAQESLQLDKLQESHQFQELAQGATLAASIISLIPDIDLGASGFGGSPLAKFKIGGINLGQAAELASDILSFLSTLASNDATMAGIRGGHDRRWDNWRFQEDTANAEIEHIDQQITAMEVQIQVAEQDLKNQKLIIENAKTTEDFMVSKYTNKDLYQWMIGQISQVYFQSYQLAYDLAKRAERCYRFELGIRDSSFISFGYWNNLKKGLLSGQKLQYDLRRLETDYLEQHKREYELTKHVSLANLNPLALIQLRETGRCFFSFPEEIFDLDYPGHYFRRIKSVSVSIPCVAGPYTTVSATLRLLTNHIRHTTTIGDGYQHQHEDGVWIGDTRFMQQNVPTKAIATGSGQQDPGLFQLNFMDERYLPFEGAGVISDWSFELFNDAPDNNPDPANPDWGRPMRQFDFSTINDVVIHVKYTAREDAGPFKNAAIAHLREFYDTDDGTPMQRVLNLKQAFPDAWHRMQNPVDEADGNVLSFEIGKNLFPYKDTSQTLKINALTFFARGAEAGDYEITLNPPIPPVDNGGEDEDVTIALAQSETYGNLHFAARDTTGDGIAVDFTAPQTWRLTIQSPTGNNLAVDELTDVFVVLGYEWD